VTCLRFRRCLSRLKRPRLPAWHQAWHLPSPHLQRSAYARLYRRRFTRGLRAAPMPVTKQTLKFQRYNENRIAREPGLEHLTGRGENCHSDGHRSGRGARTGNYDVRLAAEDFEWAAELVRIAGDILVKEAPSEMEADLTRGEMVKKIITTPQKHGGETTGRVISRTLPNVSNDARRGRRPENVGRPRNDLDRVRRFCSFWTWRRFTMSHQKCPRIS